MAMFPLVERFNTRLKANFATEAEKNIGEQLGKAAATYLAGTEFFGQIRKTLERIFGRVASDWLGKIGGIGAAAGIGSPEPLVKFLMFVGNTRPQAEHIAGEALDEFLKTFAEGLSSGVPIEDAAEDAIVQRLQPKLVEAKVALDKICGIVHYGAVVSVHTTDCKEVCKPLPRSKQGGKAGFDINQNKDKPNKDDKDKDKDKDQGPKYELIEGAEIMSLEDMIAHGIDVEKQSTCKCRGLIKEFRHFVDRPRTFLDCRIALSKGSATDQELEKAFYAGLQRLTNANPDQIKEANVEGFRRRLDQPVWTIDRARLAIQKWNPSEQIELDNLMKSAMLAFGFRESWSDNLLHNLQQIGIAYIKGEGSPVIDAVQARVKQVDDGFIKRTATLKKQGNLARRLLRQGK